MTLTSTSIRRPIFILMVVAGLLVMGIKAAMQMRVELNPKVELPVVSVTVDYPGAGPEEVETQVTKKVEDAVASVNGIKEITSNSQEGSSTVSISFNYGVSNDVAAADVREKVASIREFLPTAAKDPVVQKFDFNSQPVLYYGLSGKRSSRDMRDLADNVIKQRLSKVNGVAAVSIAGGDVREILVSIKKERLEAYGISIAQFVALNVGNNQNSPVGRITEGDREYSVRVVGEYQDLLTIMESRLRMPNGQTVRLTDIADVADTIAENRGGTRVNQVDSVSVIIQKTSEGNTIEVANGVKAEIKKLEKELPPDVKFVLNQDTSVNVADNVHDVQTSLFLGSFLAVFVVYLFLHNLRGTFIVAIAIPTSVIATFLPMYAFGFTLNGMTLLALSLAVGILVDDSIVVLENIYRHLAKGEEPIEAAINGRSEIGLAAVTITLVDVVVFIPIAFMGGVTGQFFRSFGVTVAVATLFSLFMSFTLTPMLASRWYRSGEGKEAEHGLFGVMNRFYSLLDRIYRGVLATALKYRGSVVYAGFGILILVFVAIIASVAGPGFKSAMPGMMGFFVILGLILNWRYKFVGLGVIGAGVAAVFLAFSIGINHGGPLLLFRFAPDQDQGQVNIIGELPAGTTVDKTMAVAKRIEKVVATVPDVSNMFLTVGASTAGQSGLANVGPQYFTFSLKLRDKVSLSDSINPAAKTDGMRKRDQTKVADEIREKVGNIPGVRLKIAALTGFSAGGSPLQIDMSGVNLKEMTAVGEKVLAVLKSEPGVINADISTRIGKPEQQIVIDREKAASYGMSIASISQVLRVALEGDDSLIYRERGNEYKIRVRFNDNDRKDTSQLRNLVVGSVALPDGRMQMVRLGDVARDIPATGPTKIERKDRQKLVSVTADVAPGFAPGNMQIGIDKKLKAINFGSINYAWSGENKTQAEEGQYMGAAFMLAIVLVYMLMAALFENLLTPLVIMLSLPQAMAGALLGLMAFGHSLTIVAMIGIIMLIGLVTKNAILLVDYTNTLRERGYTRTDAILEAGPTRLRPILMTTIAMIGGMLPTALGLGRGAEFRAPLASPVIGGLVLSTLLTLVVIPCVYTYFDDLNRIIGRIFFRKRLVQNPVARETTDREKERV